MNDFRLALRQLRKTPAFTAVAVLSIAIGIGANTAIFTLVNEFLLRSLPVRHPEELVLFRAIHGTKGRMSRRGEGPGFIDPATGRTSGTPLSLLMFERFRTHRSALSDVIAFAPFSQVNVLIDGTPETAGSAQYVSGNYYAGLGVGASLGRTLTQEDDRTSASPVAVISYRFWERRFAGDPAVLGTTLVVNRVPTTVVGVTPRGFDGAMQAGETADISVAFAHHLRYQPEHAGRAQPWYWWVRVMGRLAPGATPAQARASLEPLFQQAAREGWLASQAVEPGGTMPDEPLLAVDPGGQGENDFRRQNTRSLRILMGLVALVLLAACANVANLLIARGNARRREIALRMALGGRRGRLVRQLLAESLVLALGGAAGGVLMAWWGRGALVALQPFGTASVVLDLPLDARVLTFALLCAIATAAVFGVAPALRATRVDLTHEFQGGTRSVGSGGRSRLSQTMMVVQVALSLVLLVSTGLFVRTINHLQHVHPGFNTSNLVLFQVDSTSAGYKAGELLDLHARIQERLAGLPGVRVATFSRVPLLSGTRQNMRFTIPGRPAPPGAPTDVNTNGLAPNFFAAMELAVVLGRGFTERDTLAAPKVAVVNQAFARTYLGGDGPIGQHIVFNAPNFQHRVEIIGVARDAKYTTLRGGTPPTVYFSALQQPDGRANYAIRMESVSSASFAAIRAAVREIDSTLPVLNLRTQATQIERLHSRERLFARLSGFFGVTALALACVGLYGLMSYSVLRRAGEIGVRMALGARPAQMLQMVVSESLVLVSIGVALGLAAAYWSCKIVATMLFGVSPRDPLTYGGVAVVLLSTALVASLVPAYRASRIEPMKVLRSDRI